MFCRMLSGCSFLNRHEMRLMILRWLCFISFKEYINLWFYFYHFYYGLVHLIVINIYLIL